MLHVDRANLPPPSGTGLLSEKPLAQLLVYARDRALSGTFELVHDSAQSALVVLARGSLARVWTSEPVVYLGQVLRESGVIDDAQLAGSLDEARTTQALHGQVLVGRGVIDGNLLASALGYQRVRKIHHAFSLPPASRFNFYANADLIGDRPFDPPSEDVLPCLWRGIAANPPDAHVRSIVDAFGSRAMRLVAPFDMSAFRQTERAAVESLLEAPATLADLASRPGVDPRVAELIVYFLVLTKLVAVVDPTGVATSLAPPPPLSGASLFPEALQAEIRRVSGSIPAPEGGSIPPPSIPPSSPRVPAAPSSSPSVAPGPLGGSARPSFAARFLAPPPPNPEADNAITQAEMSFMLGDRHQALELVKQAMTISPRMPAGLALLAALEASNVKEGQEDKLRSIVGRLDSIIAMDPKCRRARFYRGRLRRKLGDLVNAVEDLRAAVEDDPEDVDAARELKICERKAKDAPKAGGSLLGRLLRK